MQSTMPSLDQIPASEQACETTSPKLTTLPPELINEIVKYGLDSDDFLALCMTSKEFNDVFQERYRKALFENRSLYRQIAASYDNLLSISKHPSGVNTLVKIITIQPTLLYYRRPHFNHSKRFETKAYKDKENLLYKKLVDSRSDALEEMRAFGAELSESTILSLALLNFPNLETIDFGVGKYPMSRHELNLFFPWMGLKPGKRVPRWVRQSLRLNSFDSIRPSVDEAWDMIPVLLNAVAYGSPSPIKELRVPSNFIIPMRCFNMSKSRLAHQEKNFAGLTRLSLTVSVEDWLCEDLDELDRQVTSNPLFDWLEAVGQNLEELDLSYSERPRWNNLSYDHKYDIPNDMWTGFCGGLSRLRSLKLKNIYFDSNYMLGTLHSSENIEVLEFRNCVVHKMAKGWYHLIRELAGGACKKLRRFYFTSGTKGERFLGDGVPAPFGPLDEDQMDFDQEYDHLDEEMEADEIDNIIAPGATLERQRVTLPGLELNERWDKPGANWRVSYYRFGAETSWWVGRKKYGTIGFVDMSQILTRFNEDQAGLFWDHISNGNWLDQKKPVTRIDLIKEERAEIQKRSSKRKPGRPRKKPQVTKGTDENMNDGDITDMGEVSEMDESDNEINMQEIVHRYSGDAEIEQSFRYQDDYIDYVGERIRKVFDEVDSGLEVDFTEELEEVIPEAPKKRPHSPSPPKRNLRPRKAKKARSS